MPLLACQLSASQTILIDYDDGNAGNGVHDANVNDGDFGLQQTTSTTLVNAPWQLMSASSQFQTSNASGIGSAINFVSVVNRRIDVDASGTSGYTMDVGHTLNASFMARPASAWDADDEATLQLFYTDDNTLTGTATVLAKLTFTGKANGAVNDDPSDVVYNTAWFTATSSPVIVTDTGAVGKKLFASVQTEHSVGSEFVRMDNIYVAVETSPVSPILKVDPTFSFSCGSVGGSFAIPVSNPAGSGVTTDLTITGATPTGTDSGDITVTTGLPLVISPNGNNQIDFNFTPSAGVGTYNFDLEIASDDATEPSPRIVPIQIEVQPNPALTVAATFSATNNGTSTHYTIPIANDSADGTTVLNISGVTAVNGDAGDVSNITFPASLAAGTGDVIGFDFLPSDGGGFYQFDLEIASNDQSAVSPRVVPVSIEVKDPFIAVATTSLDFGLLGSNPGPQTATVSVTNNGGATDLVVDQGLTSISGDSGFTVSSFPGPIAPGASGDIEITFDPGTDVGLFNATLSIASNDYSGATPQVALNGFVQPSGNMVASVDFGSSSSPVASGYTQFVVSEGASKTIAGVGIQITSKNGDIVMGGGADGGDLLRDGAATTFNGGGGNYISVLLTGLNAGTLNLTSFHNYNSSLGLPINLQFGEVGGTLDQFATSINRPSSVEYSATVESGKTYELRVVENGNANLAYISGLVLWGDAVPGGTPFGNFVTSAGLDPETTGQPGLDPDNDGLDTGVEWVIGGSPNDSANPDTAKLPTGSLVTADPDNDTNPSGYLLFSYRLTSEAASDSGTSATVEYGSDLAGWTEASDGLDGVVIVTTPNGYETGVNRVDVYIPTGPDKRFARLKVILLP